MRGRDYHSGIIVYLKVPPGLQQSSYLVRTVYHLSSPPSSFLLLFPSPASCNITSYRISRPILFLFCDLFMLSILVDTDAVR